MNKVERETGDMSESELNEKTKLPLGLVVACIGAFLGGALWINNSLNKIDNRLAAMEARVSDRWTEGDMKIWVMRLQMDNPSLKIPERIK